MAKAYSTCSVPECESRADAVGMCQSHYDKKRRHGDPLWEKPKLSCRVENCERPHYGNNLCNMHYQRLRKTGTTDPRQKKVSYCKIEDCGKELTPPYGRGMCGKHYGKWLKYGDPLYVAPLLNAGDCLIDGCDLPREAKGWCSKHYTRWSRYGDPEHRFPYEVQDGKRVCSHCGIDKPLSEWTSQLCKECATIKTREWRLKFPYEPVEREEFVCFVCGKAYVADPRQWKCCSEACARIDRGMSNERRRLRMLETRTEQFHKSEIFERDGWVCHLCGDSIDRDEKFPHPRSASLDHVVPIALGGEHTRANTAASHLRCNVSKGARMAS